MKTRESRPLREHFEIPTDAGEALRTFDYIEELEAYINHLEALRQPAVMPSLQNGKKVLAALKEWHDSITDEEREQLFGNEA